MGKITSEEKFIIEDTINTYLAQSNEKCSLSYIFNSKVAEKNLNFISINVSVLTESSFIFKFLYCKNNIKEVRNIKVIFKENTFDIQQNDLIF